MGVINAGSDQPVVVGASDCGLGHGGLDVMSSTESTAENNFDRIGGRRWLRPKGS